MESDRIINEIIASQEPDVTAEAPSASFDLLYNLDLSEDPAFWKNQNLAAFYGKSSVAVTIK